MKKYLLGISASAVAGLTIGATLAFAGMGAGTGITGSKHDMNHWVANGDPGYGRVCAYCHTPHHAIENADADYLPLWSHQLTTLNYTPYQSGTFNADGSDVIDPLLGPSRLCMSCHDGVVAIDNHYSFPGTTVRTGDDYGNIALANGTGDLSNDHPIGFSYLNAEVLKGLTNSGDQNIRAESSPFLEYVGTGGNAGPDDTDLKKRNLKIVDQLYQGEYMTCATCHDVHNKDNAKPAAGHDYNYFLMGSEEGSAICRSCHNK